VSFSTRDNVRVYSVWDDAPDADESQDEHQAKADGEKKEDSDRLFPFSGATSFSQTQISQKW